MHYREAQLTDISQIMVVRLSVKENILSSPDAVFTIALETSDYLTRRGKGWVCEVNGQVVAFAIVDLQDHNIWALFVQPEFARQGVGKHLHQLMLAWYFAQTSEPVWLSTAPNTRAEEFYRRQGWRETGQTEKGEVRFEMAAKEA